MSALKVEVVPVKLIPHPNADSLSIVTVYGFSCVVRTADFQNVDKAAYIPVDSVVDTTLPEFAFLQGKARIKAMRLRGTYSEGLLIPAKPCWNVGDDVALELNVQKYEPVESVNTGGENESQPDWFHLYTDIENWRRYPDKIVEGENVAIFEKLHGSNKRLLYYENRLRVGSHRNCKRYDPNNLWWKCVEKNGLEKYARLAEGYILWGEVYGNVQDLKYGAKQNDYFFGLFDISTVQNRRYLDLAEFEAKIEEWGMQKFVVPLLYKGPWNKSLISLAEGKSLVPGADNIREGIVIRPEKERYDMEIGRTILKVVGEGYRLRKGGTEKH